MESVILILGESRGMNIPRDFLIDCWGDIAEDHCTAWGLTHDNRSCWEGAIDPCLGHYWDCWSWIIDNAKYTTPDGDIYRLHQDDDLWAICYEKMTTEEKENFGFEFD